MNLATISPNDVASYISKLLRFDSILILGYQNGSHPVSLYNSLQTQYDRPLMNLLCSSYAFDPFYATFSNKRQEGIYKLEELLSDKGKFKEYRQQFHVDTERLSEIAINIQLDSRRRVTIFVRRSEEEDSFSLGEKLTLQKHFPKLKTLCRRLWPNIWATTPVTGSNQFANAIHSSLDTFGAKVLTSREQEIATLIIQGTDNKNIANRLGITVATVKAHRKKIYSKLEVSSLGEMFQLFLNHVILSSSQEQIHHQNAA